jgi:hypothetical protein
MELRERGTPYTAWLRLTCGSSCGERDWVIL